MKRRIRDVLVLSLAMIMLISCIYPVSAINSEFLRQHPDWHFDLKNEPNRAMTVEEFIALTVSYSYWSLGEGGTTPVDKNGKQPSAWAAPYIREEARKKVIDPSTIDYFAPATLAFAMNFIVNCKGLYGYNAINLRKFSGTSGLTTEQKLCLNTAIDYGYFRYTENMDVSVTLPRKDLEAKYLIPDGIPAAACSVVPKSTCFPKSMIFFEDCYNDSNKSNEEYELLKANEASYNIVSLDVLYLKSDKVDQNRGFAYAGSNLNTYQNVVEFCHQKNKMVLGGVITWFDESIMKKLQGNDAAQNRAADELVQLVDDFHLDGLNVDIELQGDTYRQLYSSLVTKIADRLHQKSKTLMLTINGSMWDKDNAKTLYDYRVVNKVADLITIITYDLYSARSYNYGGKMGEMSNYTFTSRCARYAATYFDPEKVILGLGGYGICYNTTDHKAENITMPEVAERLKTYKATPQTHNMEVDDCYFSYSAGGKNYTVYYESDAGMKRRIDLAKNYALGGVAGFYVSGNHRVMLESMENNLSALPFRDVAKNAWYYDSVKFAFEKALFNGTSSNMFSPDAPMTRAMLVTVLWRYEGQPSPRGNNTFSDVKANDWFCTAVSWASENGIVNGVGNGKFAPNNNVTREQMATILLRYAQEKKLPVTERVDISAFSDHGKVSAWAVDAIQWTVGAQIIGGTTKGKEVVLDPQGNATRAQVAKILRCFIQAYG